MGKYFGTDGIRGKANISLTADRGYKIGRYLGYYFKNKGNHKILIGKDTRLSSSMFEMAVAAGLVASGADAYLLGYTSTPNVAYLTMTRDFDAGVMISASHNPYYDNGIKIFSHNGTKLEAEIEDLIEEYIDGKVSVPYATDQNIGQVINYSCGIELYLDWLDQNFPLDLSGYKIAIDCANGSSSYTAVQLLKRTNAKIVVINNDPDGVNINTHCGSTHPESLQQLVKEEKCDLGLAFDGDADRLIAINEKGELITGDHILYICGEYLKNQGSLKDDTVVTTVMANLGLFKALDRIQINTVVTRVGDKYVYEEMKKNDYGLGGEQSGHIIFKKYLPTGDGLQTALNLLQVMVATKKPLTELAQDLIIYPQLLVNVEVHDKEAVMVDEDVLKMVQSVEKELGNDGRILVRTSGTEPLVRVMVEACNDDLCSKYVNQVVQVIQTKYPL